MFSRSAPSARAARDALWAGWPPRATFASHTTPAFRRYWCAEAAWYLASLAMLFVWEHRRSDFGAMAAHHVITVALIAGATLARLERPGAAVMALHDPADVFLEAAKIASYAGWHRLATACFACLVAVWAVTRLGVLPAIAYDGWARSASLAAAPRIPAARPLCALLFVLVGLHLFWFRLILRIAVSQLVAGGGRVTQDVRESDDAEGVAMDMPGA
jgi:ceramide synthetase